ncbi:Dodecaprenyl-phosphate galacturonate synthase [bacterium HR17]|jgi:glycosyltransferase involved in cell wall biosynthesis|uniref:Dodecaprenyl-phosphate galacturonate synthase n=1 Tax=Candidatus Fervidibacter japonicus TaxID=2035412 RepID=A0A2H5XAE0_9BACT|nr:Dodecaprenyl-phosphate galacturonate synthase [bacterium HR17]
MLDKRLSIILPAYNERGNLAPLLREIADVAAKLPSPTEVIVVDDGSTDGSPLEVEQVAPAVTPPLDDLLLVRLKGNCGQTMATTVGILHASGDVIVLMDADRQNDPADIPKLLGKLSEGFDVVSGWRRDRKDPLTKTLPSRFANALLAWATGVPVHDLGCSLRAYRAWVLQSLAREGLHHRYMPIYCAAKGARIAEVVVHHRPRTVGQSKYGLKRVFAVLKDLPLLVFLARYGQQPFAGMVAYGTTVAALTLVGIVASAWTKAMWLTATVAAMALGAVFCGLGIATEYALRLSGKRAEIARHAVAETKRFRALAPSSPTNAP